MAKGKGGFIGQDGLNAPDQVTGVTGTAGDTEIEVSFTSPADVGASPITGYRVQDGTKVHGASGSSSPITVTGLTNGTSYTFNVCAINAFGWSAPSDASEAVSPEKPQIGIFAGGFNSSSTDQIQKLDLSTAGNATDFGDLSANRYRTVAFGSATRSVFAGGTNSGGNAINIIEYIDPTGAGGAVTDFGDVSAVLTEHAGCSNSTRGLFGGGQYDFSGGSNRVDYITIASTGNSSDYGDLTVGRSELAACASTTRGLFAGGSGCGTRNIIDYRTISSTGNFIDFGDLTAARSGLAGASNSTRGLFAGADSGSANIIDYVTIASTGNATDFGDLTENKSQQPAGCAGPTKAFFAGGFNGSFTSARIDFVTIASTGNATQYGNLNLSRRYFGGTSTSHGGI